MRSLLMIATLIICLLAASTGTAQAIGSEFLSYQGKLDSAGTPINGSRNMFFRLYTVPTGGGEIWEELVSAVPVSNGLFTHMLGSQIPIPDSVFDFNELWLEVEVEGETIGTRNRLTGVAVSKRVANIDGATAGNITGTLEINPGLSPSAITVVGSANDSIIIAPDDTLSIIGTDPDGNMTMALSTKKNNVAIMLFDPVDSKDGGRVAPKKRVEITSAGIVFLDTSGTDTTANLTTEGDVVISGNISGDIPWTAFSFASGFGNYVDAHGGGFQTVQYRKIGDIVQMRGTLHHDNHLAIPDSTVLGFLPVGHRPPAVIGFPTIYGEFYIHPDGAIVSQNAPEYQEMTVISFSTTP